MHCVLRNLRDCILPSALTTLILAGSIAHAATPATLSQAFEQALRVHPDIQGADNKINTAALNQAANRASLWPQATLGWSSGMGRSPNYFRQNASLPLDITGTIDGVLVERARLENIVRGAEAPPPRLMLYRAGAVVLLTDLQRELLASSTRESSAPTSYATSYQQGMYVGVSYSLYAGGTDRRALKNASLALQDAEQDRLMAVKTLLEKIVEAYFQLRYALLQEQFDREALASGERKLAHIALQFKEGRVGRADYENAQLQYELQQLQAQKNRMEIETRRQAYCAIAALSDCFWIPSSNWDDDLADAVPDNYIQAMSKAQQVMQTKIDIARSMRRHEIEDAHSSSLPRVGLSWSAGASGGSDSSLSEAISNNRYRGWQVGLSVSWTLFDGFRNTAIVGLAQQHQADAELQIGQTLSAQEQEKQKARLASQQAVLGNRMAQVRLDLAKATLLQETVKHRHGLISLHALLDAQMKWEEAIFILKKQKLETFQNKFKSIAAGLSTNE
jgi:outer membrane protein TolC